MIDEGKRDVLIRRAGPEDAAAVAAVLREAFREYEPLYTPAAFAATTPGPHQIRSRWEEGLVFVVMQEGRVAGTVSVVDRAEDLYVCRMAVLPAAQGRKLGWHLLEHVERYAARAGFKRLVLSTTPFLDKAIWLYEKSGFRRSDKGPWELLGTPLFTMAKAL
ncbi:MAG: GNAT family N-acetyltransferase [Phycisphaerales bacterium]|nr:MAG: GNAT family N-acetyltransferase [Phycisphaerales bacterium]